MSSSGDCDTRLVGDGNVLAMGGWGTADMMQRAAGLHQPYRGFVRVNILLLYY